MILLSRRNWRSFKTIGALICLVAALSYNTQKAFAADPLKVRFVTFNVDFNNSDSKIETDVQAASVKADIMMFQEAKTVTIDDFLDSAWTVIQVVDKGDAKRGSALAIRKSIMTRKLSDGIILGVGRNGESMLDRYIIWADVEFTNGTVLRVMSLHMPPQRYAYLQPIMAENLGDFVAQSIYPVVVGADWNFTVNNDPYDIETDTSLKPKGIGIDGFFYNNDVVIFDVMFELAGLGVNSDHDPVQMVSFVQPQTSTVADWALY